MSWSHAWEQAYGRPGPGFPSLSWPSFSGPSRHGQTTDRCPRPTWSAKPPQWWMSSSNRRVTLGGDWPGVAAGYEPSSPPVLQGQTVIRPGPGSLRRRVCLKQSSQRLLHGRASLRSSSANDLCLNWINRCRRRMLAQLMSGQSRRITLAARSQARVSWSVSRIPVWTGPTATFG